MVNDHMCKVDEEEFMWFTNNPNCEFRVRETTIKDFSYDGAIGIIAWRISENIIVKVPLPREITSLEVVGALQRSSQTALRLFLPQFLAMMDPDILTELIHMSREKREQHLRKLFDGQLLQEKIVLDFSRIGRCSHY